MLLLVFHILYQVAVSQCSVTSKTGKSTVDYCKKIGNCKPGGHIMCKYGSDFPTMTKCDGSLIELDKDNQKDILDQINQVRSDIKYRNITGKNGKLPKGYGVKSLEWDDELAKFAQVWANKCELERVNLCQATAKFPYPGQFVGGSHYTLPETVDAAGYRKLLKESKRLTELKARTTIYDILQKELDTSLYVTADMVHKYDADTGHRYPFLMLVHDKATHIGCALSYWYYFSKITGTDRGYALYTALLVCNLSAQPGKGQKVYETDPKVQSRPKLKKKKQKATTPKPKKLQQNIPRRTAECNHNKLPSLVLMPVIKFENERPSTNDPRKATNPPTIRMRSTKGVFSKGELKTTSRFEARKLESKNNVTKSKSVFQLPIQRRDSRTKEQHKVDVKDRYFNGIVNNRLGGQSNPNGGSTNSTSEHLSKKPSLTKHNSIFTRVSKFELPSQHHNKNYEGITHGKENSVKRPSNTQRLSSEDRLRLEELISEYFVKKQSRPHNSPANVIDPLINTLMQFIDTYPAGNGIDAVNRHNLIMREHKALHNSENNNPNENNGFSNEEVDEKLLNFLYNLVQASGVDFSEIIDATTRIIQSDKVGKEWSQPYRKILDDEPLSTDNRPVKEESEFTPFATRKQNPLASHGKDIFGSIKNNYQKMIGRNEYTPFKNNLKDARVAKDLLSLRNIDGRTRYLEKQNINEYYAIDDSVGTKRVNYLPRYIEVSDRRNRHNYGHHNHLHVDHRPLFRPVINI